MPSNLEMGLYVFMLATFVGLEVIRRVSPLLHTPLMSLTNAISAISVVGAIILEIGNGTLRLHAGDLRRPGGDSQGIAPAAHAADVADQRHLRHLRGGRHHP